MKAIKLIKTRSLEVLIVFVLIAKLALSIIPVIWKSMSSINVVDTLAVNDALAKESNAGVNAPAKTVLASNDSSRSISQSKRESEQNVFNTLKTDVDMEKIREDLVKREALLKEREKKLEKLRLSIEKEISRLLAMQNKIKAHLEKRVAEREAKSKYLAKMYSSMKAKKAAMLMVELDDDLAVRVLKLMKPEAAGQILTYLDPKKAARLTKEFYYREE